MPDSPAERVEWLRAREGDDPRAKLGLAVLHAEGWATGTPDPEGALRYLREAAGEGSEVAGSYTRPLLSST
jgi:hypothetical protein